MKQLKETAWLGPFGNVVLLMPVLAVSVESLICEVFTISSASTFVDVKSSGKF